MSAITTNPFYFPAHEVQRPTHDRIHIRSAEEAHMLFESVRLGIFRPVIRRLNDAERSAFIRSGSVFVWEESEEAIGLRRWTDGLNWSPSRMREPFLFYESKRRGRSSTIGSNNGDRLSPDTLASPSSAGDTPCSSPRSSMDQGIPGLVKQTYSAIVMCDGTQRKWHMTAYFTNADYPHLPTIQDDPRLRGIKVPKGMYRSGKSRQSARSRQEAYSGSPLASASTPDLHFPSHEGGPRGQMTTHPPSSSSSGYESASPSGSPLMEHPRRSSPPSPYSRPPSATQRRPPSPYSVGTFPPPNMPVRSTGYAYAQQPQPLLQPPTPQFSQRAVPVQPRNHVLPPLQSTYTDQRYAPPVQRSIGRTTEDQRMLQKFRSIP